MGLSAVRPSESFVPLVSLLQAGTFTEGPDYTTWRSRGTTDWLLVHTVDGQGRFGSPGAPDLVAQPGDLVLVRPGVLHDYGTERGRGLWQLQFVHFHPRTDWLPLLDWPEVRPGVRRLRPHGEVRRRIEEALTRTVAVSRSGLTHAELFGVNALETALLWAATQRPDHSELDERVLRVVEQVVARLAEPWDVTALARLGGVSSSRLTHLFRTQLGVAPMHFVEQQRMAAARQLLELSAQPVAAVARAVGYPDPLYFSTRFARATGCSPTAYRRR
ncbi:helix-turn-helix domain-containing protein [uncultured Friedmanniella sp.]|uniref:helix-turn-helix domain-containing protein n=1 Tax=uncultured Friedmanniella sp. TaxID=335381 RepID=UPI0035CC6F7B